MHCACMRVHISRCEIYIVKHEVYGCLEHRCLYFESAGRDGVRCIHIMHCACMRVHISRCEIYIVKHEVYGCLEHRCLYFESAGRDGI